MSARERTDWSRVASLFDGALARPAQERAAWLTARCDDPALCAEVARMLAAHERGNGILDRPARAAAAAWPHPAELARRLEDGLADRYIVERELGRGGAATVYLAFERKHARRVVLKVLNPEVAAQWGHERFMREVHIAAQLSHPHIVGLIDSGEADGLLYYVMPYVEGETLRARLDRRGALPLREALTLLCDVAGALGYAHRAGVVHRDLKPANVLCVGEHAFLMDFGIAKLVAPVHAPGDLTRDGLVVGTPAYMAPEQLEAAAVDPRADLYAWGLLAHEILTGALAGPATRERWLHGEPPRPDVPADLAALVAACLAPQPSLRPASADVVLDTLTRLLDVRAPRRALPYFRHRATAGAPRRRRWWMAGAAVSGALALAAAGMWRGRTPDAGFPLRSPVVVAQLVNETGDPSLELWGRMAGDWLTQGLQQTGVVSVVPWGSALGVSEALHAERAAGRRVDPVARLRDETGAATVITGSYYLVDDSLHFRVEITDARAGRLVSALPPVVTPRDSAQLAIPMLRDRLMGAAALLSDDRLARSAEIARRPPLFEAYRAFDDGLQRYLAQDYEGAAPALRHAFELDTTFLTPLVYAMNAYWNRGEFARLDSALRIVGPRRDELTAYGRLVVASLEARMVGNGESAREALREAVRLSPGSRAAYSFAVIALETDFAPDALTALRSLEPDRGAMRGWSSYWTQLTHALHLTGDHDGELAAARALRAAYPDRRVGVVLEARALAAAGRTQELEALLAAVGALPPTVYWSQGAAMVVAGEELRAHGFAAAGERWLARGDAWLVAQLALTPAERGHRYWLASARYDRGRWVDAYQLFSALSREQPARLDYRGMTALAARRAGVPGAEAMLGTGQPYERGTHAAFQARLAALRGDHALAVATLADAVRAGVDGLPWLHASAYPDLAPLAAREGGSLPQSLRVVPRRAGDRAPAVVSALRRR